MNEKCCTKYLPVKQLQEELKREMAKNKSGNVDEDTKMPAKTKSKRKLPANLTSTKLLIPQVKRTKFAAPVEFPKQKAAIKTEPKSEEPIAKNKTKSFAL